MIVTRSRTAALVLAGFIVYGSVLGTDVLAGPPKSGKAASIAGGKMVYEANKCANCHAIQGKGGKVGPDLTRTGASPKHTVAWFAEEVKNPKSHKPDSKMPAYADKIKGKDLQALATYLSSLKK
jgi:cytochrome c oxidase subunit 2